MRIKSKKKSVRLPAAYTKLLKEASAISKIHPTSLMSECLKWLTVWSATTADVERANRFAARESAKLDKLITALGSDMSRGQARKINLTPGLAKAMAAGNGNPNETDIVLYAISRAIKHVVQMGAAERALSENEESHRKLAQTVGGEIANKTFIRRDHRFLIDDPHHFGSRIAAGSGRNKGRLSKKHLQKT